MKTVISHNKTLLLSALLLLSGVMTSVCAQNNVQSSLVSLNRELGKAREYDNIKRARIDSLKKALATIEHPSFADVLPVYEEYALFNFDSAFFYANKLIEAAKQQHNDSLLGASQIRYCFVLLSSGMYKNVFDTLESIDPGRFSLDLKREYHILKARAFFDLSDYNKQKVSNDYYTREGSRQIDSVIELSPEGSFERVYYSALKLIRNNKVSAADSGFRLLLKRPQLDLHQQALVYSTYSDLFLRKGSTDSAIMLLCEAAIADIRSSTKETSAMLNLSTQLFKKGQIRLALDYIQKAASDARAYGARQRIIQLSEVMPVIQAENLSDVERDKRGITWYAWIISISCLVLTTLGSIIYRQVQKLKKQQKEINNKNLSLHRLVEEKEWLLREIHHRVKNNLHTITSLLESQSAYLKDEALKAVKDSQHRVFAMSLIHQRLYNTDSNVTTIDMQSYLTDLVNYLKDSLDHGGDCQIRIDSAPLSLDVSIALPIGLVLNEGITNSIKHAFPNKKGGIIDISMLPDKNNNWLFRIKDNGRGLPDNFDIDSTQSLGVRLMKGLSEDIVASFSIQSDNGTCLTIELNIDKSIKHLSPRLKETI